MTNSLPGRLLRPQDVVEQALRDPGEGRIVLVEERSEADVRFANNTTTTNGLRRSRRVSVVSLRAAAGGVSVGVASSTAVGADEVDELVAASVASADGAPAAEDEAPLLGPGGDPEHWEDPPPVVEPAALEGVLGPLGAMFRRARAESRVLSGFAEHGLETVYLGSSTGLRRRHVQPGGHVELVARSADGTRSAWAGAGIDRLSDVDLPAMDERLVRRLEWSKRQLELPAGRYQAILPPDAVADLVILLYEAASGREAEEGRSVFSAPGGGTRLGERLTDRPFRLRSDPAEAGLQCSPFLAATASGSDQSVFDNGLGLGPTSWVADGRLANLRYHRARAVSSGAHPTPPIDNLVLELPGATSDLDEMVAGTDRALLLTCLWYIREVDPVTLLVTGLTRDGVYLVEGGEVVGAVNNFRFNESPLDVLRRSGEAGRTERALSREWNEWFSRTAMPALRVEDFNMSTVSPAS